MKITTDENGIRIVVETAREMFDMERKLHTHSEYQSEFEQMLDANTRNHFEKKEDTLREYDRWVADFEPYFRESRKVEGENVVITIFAFDRCDKEWLLNLEAQSIILDYLDRPFPEY